MSAKALGDLVISLGLDAGPLKAGLAGVGGLFNNVLKGGAFETGKNLVEGLFGTPRDVIVDSVKLAASWERSATEFEVFTGSADKAKGVMQDLRKFAAESPLTLSKSIEQAKRLMADPTYIDGVLADGSARARTIAKPVMDHVKDIVGFIRS